MNKKLYLSDSDKKICGVCGGIAEYFNIDSTLIRLLFVVAVLAGFSGILAYIICAVVIPSRPMYDGGFGGENPHNNQNGNNGYYDPNNGQNGNNGYSDPNNYQNGGDRHFQ